MFFSVSTCRKIWGALDSLHGREYEWHSHTFARESSAIWEITLEQVIIDAEAATAHMHMHKKWDHDAEICPARSIMQSLEAKNVPLLRLCELWVRYKTIATGFQRCQLMMWHIYQQPSDYSFIFLIDVPVVNRTGGPMLCPCLKPALALYRFVEVIHRLITHHWFSH